MVLSFGKALVSRESRLKQKQPASSGEDTRLAIDFHLMIPRRMYQILPNRMAVIARCAISYVVLYCLFRIIEVLVILQIYELYFERQRINAGACYVLQHKITAICCRKLSVRNENVKIFIPQVYEFLQGVLLFLR